MARAGGMVAGARIARQRPELEGGRSSHASRSNREEDNLGDKLDPQMEDDS